MKMLASLAAVFGLATAGAASAQDVRIQCADLDLSSASGVQAFNARLETVAENVCRDVRRPGSLLRDRAFCREALMREAVRQLPLELRAELGLTRRVQANA